MHASKQEIKDELLDCHTNKVHQHFSYVDSGLVHPNDASCLLRDYYSKEDLTIHCASVGLRDTESMSANLQS